jgi:hypothetical protein
MKIANALLPASFLLASLRYAVAISIRGPGSDKQVIAQMFEWSWDSIASEGTNVLGPAGWGFVQGYPFPLAS